MDKNNSIKTEFFSDINNKFLLEFIIKNNDLDTISKDTIFRLQNNVYNTFMESVYNKSIDISQENIEEILISLNKMVLLEYKNKKNTPQLPPQLQQQQIQLSQIQPQIQQPLQIQPLQPPQIQSLQIQPLQPPQIQSLQIQPQQIQQQCITTFINFFSKKLNNDGIYNINLNGNFKIKYIEFTNLFLNINENNNSFELIENSVKFKIFIPIGNYDLNKLINIIKNLINEKSKYKKENENENYNILFDKFKNQLLINSQKVFGIKFIDKLDFTPQLRDILGFSNIEYINNTNYSSKNNLNLNYYDNIYLSFNDESYNKFKTNLDFSYFVKLKFNSFDTFGQKIEITLNENINVITKGILPFSFFIYTNQGFKLINEYIDFNLLFEEY